MMSAVGPGTARTGPSGVLHRPYTVGTFQRKLLDFEELIKELTLQDIEATPEERRQLITENLRYDQFCESIRALFGSDIKNQDLKAIYRKISTNPDAKVDWSELFGYFQSEGEDQDLTVGEEVNVFTVSKKRRVGEAAGDKKRRDTLQCIKYISAIDCYLTASQKGALSIWNMKLRLQACADINESAWVTGCDYLPGIRRVAACTERSIAIWDNRAKGKNQNVFVIKPIEDSPQCLTYVPNPTTSHEDTFIYGDDKGFIKLVTLAAKDLTMKNSKGDKKNTQNLVVEPANLTNKMKERKAHDDWVVKVKYFPELHCFGSCSPSSISSFVLEEVERAFSTDPVFELRGVSIPKGVNAFDYCARANIIATGGVDKVIRVWHPHIFSRPTGKLIGHLFTIVDIVCNEKDQHIISLSTARVFRVWDIHTLTSLQVFTDNEERPGEKRIYSMLFDNKNDRLLTGSSVLDAWPLTRAVQDTMQVPHTHDRPIVQILYNKELNQIISVCTESVIKVWEMDTGKHVYQITEAHGPNIEVTALTLDSSGYRLATGALDGSVKIWDFGSGQEIKCRPGRGTDEDFSITGLEYYDLNNERCILASGWNNKILILVDGNDGHDLPVLREIYDEYFWPVIELPATPPESPFNKNKPLPSIGDSGITLDQEERREHILTSHELTCMGRLSSDVVLSGCVNGNVVAWDVDKGCVDNVFCLPEVLPSSADTDQIKIKQPTEHRIYLVRVLVHKVRKLDPAYIKTKLTHHASEEEVTSASHQGRKNSHAHTQSSRVGSAKVDESVAQNLVDEADHDEQKQKDEDAEGAKIDQSGEDKDENEAGKDDEGKDEVETKTHKDEDDEEDGTDQKDDPEKHMIVETFPPVVVTCHHDAFIRFWSAEGDILREVTAMTRRQGSPVTALCSDDDCNILVTGDQKGYLVMWEVTKFLENPQSDNMDHIKQLVCWRAHTMKVVSLQYVQSLKAIISGSADGSVRVWWGFKGRFVGFFNQHRPFIFPTSEEMAGPMVLPYDISERPVAPTKNKSARQKIRVVQKFEYPLVFDSHRWKPSRRSAYIAERSKRHEPEEKKFFEALIKPKAYNDHLPNFDTGHVNMEGAVYRTLPVYQVGTYEAPKTPDLTFPINKDDEKMPSYLYTGSQTQAKTTKTTQPKGSKDDKGKSKKGKGDLPLSFSPTRRR